MFDPNRIRIDKYQFPVRKLRLIRRVLRIETVLLEALCAEGGAGRYRIELVSSTVDGGTLETTAPIGVGGAGVWSEAADGVDENLVEEKLGEKLGVGQSERVWTTLGHQMSK